MPTQRFYQIWVIRSRVTLFAGWIIAMLPFWVDSIGNLNCSGLIILGGMFIAVLGIADAFGAFQRRKVRQAIAAHDRHWRGLD